MSDDRKPLSRAELMAWSDPSLLTLEELHRLVAILRDELSLSEAREVLSRNSAEIKAERKARAKGAR